MFGARKAPEINVIEWINSNPLRISDLNGKVVLVDFWTYTCINCVRTLPYIKSWWEKYKDKGLIIIGVHSPEFEFEKELENVQRAVKEFEIKYPVAVDSEMNTWRAYDNHYWPAKYLVNKEGKIVYTHFGEGKYEETEKTIQKLLGTGELSLTHEKPVGYHVYVSPETYAGSLRSRGIGSAEACTKEGCIYVDQGQHERDIIYLHGAWIQKPEYVELLSGEGKFAFRFYAREVNVVMHPVAGKVDGKVTIDAKEATGEHVKNGKVTVDKPAMYNVHKNDEYGEKELLMTFDKPIRIYALTFG